MLKYRNVRTALFACALMAAAIGLTLTIGASANQHTSLPTQNQFAGDVTQTAPELTLEAVSEIAVRVALSANEPAPTNLTTSRGSFGAAQAVMDPQSDSPRTPSDPELATWMNSSAYLVTMRGHFTPPMPHPSGYQAPSGTVMGLIIDAHTGFVEGRYVGADAPDLSRLGSVVELGKSPTAEAAAETHSGRRKAAFLRSAVIGRLYAGGGGMPLHNGKIRRAHLAPYWPVVLRERSPAKSPKIVAITTTGKDGSFVIPIRPGRYQIAGRFPGGKICSGQYVIVRAHRHTRVLLGCGGK